MTLALIWARTPAGVIGAGGTLPWHLPEDLAHFKALTHGHPVIMGRSTWLSLPRRPLPGRPNIVLSRDPGFAPDGAAVAPSLPAALAVAGSAWVIGGGAVYAEALPLADRVVETVVDLEVDGDTFAPALDPREWRLADRDPDDGWHTSVAGPRYRVLTWERAAGRDERVPPDGER